MEKVTKYIAIRETAGMNARTYRRYEEYEDEELAIAWFAGGDLGACRTVSIYAVEFDEGESLSTLKTSEKRNIPNVGTLVYKKRNDKVLFDIREQESKAPAEPEHEEAKAEPVMSEWRVSSNGWGEDKSYHVYRIRNVNETDHSGNRENRGGVFTSHEEAKAYADKLNAGIDPDAEVEETMEEAEAPANGSDVVCYYVVLKIAENRKQTKIHYRRKQFWDDQKAINFARSRLRGKCINATVLMYDPATESNPESLWDENMNDQLFARLLLFHLAETTIYSTYYSIGHIVENDMRDEVRKKLMEHDQKLDATA